MLKKYLPPWMVQIIPKQPSGSGHLLNMHARNNKTVISSFKSGNANVSNPAEKKLHLY